MIEFPKTTTLMNNTILKEQFNITTNQFGISPIFYITYSSYYKLLKNDVTVIGRIRKYKNIFIMDFQIKNSNLWYKGFENNKQLCYYLTLVNNKLAIKTMIDYLIIKSIKKID
jgi:hypothetical protein